ncbi:hypothetical protein THF1C08_100149 [Vibrio jasicida]|uniref:Uncharacterized protein n=1 Tax=Vibrio jasicida TaxID=766224 RepID=A0AAU9QY47_9VIBR|nr:hypothetical protein THF1C08_100149 [Vibrio jasicida]CAH1604044.1 hypothetical protein THF1A12_90148 [Vibrio jasicida]
MTYASNLKRNIGMIFDKLINIQLTLSLHRSCNSNRQQLV